MGGEDFGGLAAAYSQDPTSNTQRGDLGYVRLSQLVGPLQSVVSSLGAGEVWMYHVSGGGGLRLTERRNDQQDRRSPPERRVVLGERIDRWQWAGIGCALAAIVLIVRPA